MYTVKKSTNIYYDAIIIESKDTVYDLTTVKVVKKRINDPKQKECIKDAIILIERQDLDKTEARKFIDLLENMHRILQLIDTLIKTSDDFDNLVIWLGDEVIRPHKSIADGVVLLCPKDTIVIGNLKAVEV